MRLAFCLYRYSPHSGLARDMLRIGHEAVRRGHLVDVYAREWQGDRPSGIQVKLLDAPGWTNHGRAEAFARRLAEPLRRGVYDAVVGFNKMPGLDFYYAADGCFAARARRGRPRAYELTPRYRSWRRQEASVFSPGARTRIMLLSEAAGLEYRAYYATPGDRLCRLPPTLDPRHRLGPLEPERRAAIRGGLGVAAGETLLLMVGSGFRTKGVDRSIRALAALPAGRRDAVRLVVVGQGKPGWYRRLARRLGVAGRVYFAGGRDNVPDLLRAADLLLHPARQENTGSVLLEALAAGLPVLTTSNCGYAHHVRDAGAGTVVDTPFGQHELDEALRRLMEDPDREAMCVNARRHGQDEALYRMPEAVVARIENWGGGDTIGAPAFTGCVDPELAELSRNLPRLSDWLRLEGEELRRTRDRRTLRFEHGGRRYFIKAHFGVGWKEIFKNLFQLKVPVLGAGNEWLAVHLLKAMGIPTMDAVACGYGRGLANRESFIVTRELSGMISLEEYAEREQTRIGGDPALRRELLRRVATTARALHGNGINHRDFYLCHFLFTPPGPDQGPGTLHVIDLHRAQVRHRTPRRWRIKDIAGLYYSAFGVELTHRDRLRFIRAYTGGGNLRQALSDRRFWARVERRAFALKQAETRRGYADSSRAAKHLN
ncbi:MAG: lipopolysaccharide core heptose(I) kinase RfaP [Gammaproteobacteria bacterium]|nr:lipopolysaccharide core heptose(I) kinase RfaP [Gammaproteobacteria bacterium]